MFRLRHPEVITHGFVFLGRRVRVSARRDYGRVVLGKWVHLGDGTTIRAHEGTVAVGDKCVFGTGVVVNAYSDIEIGAASLIADGVYIWDFDHAFTDADRPIKDQGIVKAPVRIGPDCWLGTRVTVLRGARIGAGCVIGAHAVVRGEIPPRSVAVGIPARVVRSRP